MVVKSSKLHRVTYTGFVVALAFFFLAFLALEHDPDDDDLNRIPK